MERRRTELLFPDGVRRFLRYRLRGQVDPERLVRRGLRLGADVYIAPGVTIDPRHCMLVSIGDEAVLTALALSRAKLGLVFLEMKRTANELLSLV